MSLLKEEKAQTSLEYILLIAGVVLAATAIGLMMKEATRKAASSAANTPAT